MPLPKVEGTNTTTAASSQQPARRTPPPLVAEMAAPDGMTLIVPRPMRQWDTPGMKVMRYFLRLRPSSKFVGRAVVELVDDDGIIDTWAAPDMLEQALRGLPERAVVCIHYRGEVANPGQQKGETKHFQVFTTGA